MLLNIALGLLALIAILAVIVAMQPNHFRIERSVTINAPAAAVYAQIVDFHKWEAWSPWEKVDPNVKRTYGGPQSGVGATYAWSGDRNVGSGNMEIKEVKPNELVRIRLQFSTPMAAVNTTDFIIKQEGGSVTLTQAMYGSSNFVGKAFTITGFNERMIGPQFQKGLNDIKALSESTRS